MVIDNFNIERMAALKPKTKPPLAVDANTVTARPVALECFKTVIGRNP